MKRHHEPGVIPNTTSVHAICFYADGSYHRTIVIGWAVDDFGLVEALFTEGVDSDGVYCLVETISGETCYRWPFTGVSSSLDEAIEQGRREAKELYERLIEKHPKLPRLGERP
jgi:hypothetical protein